MTTLERALRDAGVPEVLGTDSVWDGIDLATLESPVTVEFSGHPGGFERAVLAPVEFSDGTKTVNVILARDGRTVTASLDRAGHLYQLRKESFYDDLRTAIATGLFKALATLKRIPWEILPPGKYPWEIENVGAGGDSGSASELEPSRIKFFESLNPDFRIRGKQGFSRYVGFVFNESESGRVFLENPWTQNAVYCFDLVEGLVNLITLTKSEVLNGRPDGFIGRVVHSKNWQNRVMALMP